MRLGQVITPGGALSVVVVVGGLFMWGGEVDERLKAVSARVGDLEDRMDRREGDGTLVQRELAGLAAKLDAVQAQQDRIYGLLKEGSRK